MAHFLRLSFAASLLSLVLPALAAFAPYERVVYLYNQQNQYFDSLDAACAVAFPVVIASIPQAFKPVKGQKVTDLGDQGGRCEVESSGNGWYSASITRVLRTTCPPNASLSAGLCVCSEGAKEQVGPDGKNICVQDKPYTAEEVCTGLSVAFNAWKPSNSPDRRGVIEDRRLLPLDKPFLTCKPVTDEDMALVPAGSSRPAGCKHMFTPQMRYRMSDTEPWRYEGDSWAVWQHDAESGGTAACVPGLDDAPGDPDIPRRDDPKPGCERGIPGSVNGVEVCIDPSSGHTEGVDWTRVTDAEGNTREIKTEVKCQGEKCTVTTTSKVPGSNDPGNVTTTTTTRGQYCAKNPESSVCKGDTDVSGSTRNQNGRGGSGDPAEGGGNGDGDGDGEPSSFGGSCMAGFSCDGDAIQCAIAREQHRRACALFDDPSDESRLYDAEKVKDPSRDVTAMLPGNETVDVSGRIRYDDVLGGGACVADLNIQVMRQSITLPISTICPQLGYLGYVLVAVASLVAARIVSGVSRE